jgi:hypothetical protein
MKTISLENAKRLQELGLTSTESHFFYMVCGGMNYLRPRATTRVNPCDVLIPSYTADEIGNMLPEKHIKDGVERDLHMWWFGGWRCGYLNEAEIMLYEEGDTMADAMALMLVYLLENKYINAAGLNEVK